MDHRIENLIFFRPIVTIYTTDNSLAGLKTFKYRIYQKNTIIRDYLFSATFRENTRPLFDESVTDVVINWGFNHSLTLPIGIDAEGDMVNYQLTHISNNSNPLNIEYDFSVDTVVKFIDPTWTSVINEYNYKISGNESDGGYSTEDNFTVTLNSIPIVIFDYHFIESFYI